MDGTLVDSAQNIAAAVNRARLANGLPQLSLRAVVPCIGGGSRVLIERALFGMVPAGSPPIVPALDPAAVDFEPVYLRFLADYEQSPTEGLHYYDGVLDALEWWAERGVPQAVLTNKPHKVSVNLIEKLGIARYFTQVIGPGAMLDSAVVLPKPNTRALESIIADNGVARDGVWMIGDGTPDIRVAHAAGVNSLGILNGLYPPDHLRSVSPPPTITCETFRDAFEFLKELPC